MASNTAPTSAEYITHHLGHLTNTGKPQTDIIDFTVLNIDTLFWSISMGLLVIGLLWMVARKATSGVPGRFQAAF
jgi:F-type H+-transporting ATPase subunit a